MSARVMAGNIRQKLYVNLRWLFDDISGSMCSFELASRVAQDIIIVHPWIAAGSSRKSYERLGWIKVSSDDENDGFHN